MVVAGGELDFRAFCKGQDELRERREHLTLGAHRVLLAAAAEDVAGLIEHAGAIIDAFVAPLDAERP